MLRVNLPRAMLCCRGSLRRSREHTHENLGCRCCYRIAGRASLCPRPARSQIRGGGQGKVADGEGRRQGGRAGLQTLAGQYSGTKERGPLGSRAQRQCAAKGRGQDRAGEAEGQARQRRKAITQRFRAKWVPVRVKKTRQNKKPRQKKSAGMPADDVAGCEETNHVG